MTSAADCTPLGARGSTAGGNRARRNRRHHAHPRSDRREVRSDRDARHRLEPVHTSVIPACAGMTEVRCRCGGGSRGAPCCARRDTRGERGYDGLLSRGCGGAVLRGYDGLLSRGCGGLLLRGCGGAVLRGVAVVGRRCGGGSRGAPCCARRDTRGERGYDDFLSRGYDGLLSRGYDGLLSRGCGGAVLRGVAVVARRCGGGSRGAPCCARRDTRGERGYDGLLSRGCDDFLSRGCGGLLARGYDGLLSRGCGGAVLRGVVELSRAGVAVAVAGLSVLCAARYPRRARV